MLPVKFAYIWPNGFRGDFLEIDQPETRIAYGDNVYKRIWLKLAIFMDDFPQMLSNKLWLIGQSGIRGEDFQKLTNQKQEFPLAPMFSVMHTMQHIKLYTYFHHPGQKVVVTVLVDLLIPENRKINGLYYLSQNI